MWLLRELHSWGSTLTRYLCRCVNTAAEVSATLKQRSAGVNTHLCLVRSRFTVMTHSYIRRKTTGFFDMSWSDLLCSFGSLAPIFSKE